MVKDQKLSYIWSNEVAGSGTVTLLKVETEPKKTVSAPVIYVRIKEVHATFLQKREFRAHNKVGPFWPPESSLWPGKCKVVTGRAGGGGGNFI